MIASSLIAQSPCWDNNLCHYSGRIIKRKYINGKEKQLKNLEPYVANNYFN